MADAKAPSGVQENHKVLHEATVSDADLDHEVVDETDEDQTSSSGTSSDDDDYAEDEDEDEDAASTNLGDDNDGGGHGDHSQTETRPSSGGPRKPDLDLKSRLAAFLPQMRKANEILEDENEQGVIDRRIDEVGEDADRYIEMDLGLGVLCHSAGGGGGGGANGQNNDTSASYKAEDEIESDSAQQVNILQRSRSNSTVKRGNGKPGIQEI